MSESLNKFASERLHQLEQANLLRSPQTSTSQGVRISRNGQELINFSSNDYLGLAHDWHVIQAGIRAAEQYGNGATASRLITGNHPLYDELESKIAEYYGVEAACVFGSGYMANIGTIPALVGKGDLIVADKLSHACMIDGSFLSEAEFKRFKHNDIENLRKILAEHRGKYKNCLILSEGVFSMDGDKAPVKELQKIAQEFDCWLMVDNAHLLEKPEVKTDVIMGTLSKGFGGYGGYIAGSNELVRMVKSTARSFIFTTGLPPSVIGSAIECFNILKVKNELYKTPLKLAKAFYNKISDIINITPPQSQIVPVILGEVNATLQLQKQLEESGLLVHAIRPPTVPQGSARLRVSFTALHDETMVENLAEAIKKFIV
jgi:8-amino-7-oxononanoate synthase